MTTMNPAVSRERLPEVKIRPCIYLHHRPARHELEFIWTDVTGPHDFFACITDEQLAEIVSYHERKADEHV